ncbi:hypothetical protein PAXRUDRAFT_324053 [Paxillus rubicundulus Ve08.2h10]|uniref:Uncharacterized protein n=1 Tax=Paxillus rubicundulus Ve08.2h10 TaxID=930991 RepID=A0A0D0DCT3_9AGAM|nr:hypothetical protein PAXRUDRAFT_324053 [Paxillus rubicundulus Ve08.2h10]
MPRTSLTLPPSLGPRVRSCPFHPLQGLAAHPRSSHSTPIGQARFSGSDGASRCHPTPYTSFVSPYHYRVILPLYLHPPTMRLCPVPSATSRVTSKSIAHSTAVISVITTSRRLSFAG